ncbi:amino-acid N-acetyltransferase [Cocleimonas flava]|uniref:Amino-acid acetyltransferase n=1 Tax=Cocleimonas flava TaxID=634765 RepID=A0A4R1F4P1_9GAMM|nr:amino-acid N-acetyltransferase [Cocleimonas flava]TCJ88330.1 N-acetylglutamate synthase [Cocleimonas flava]
MNNSRIDFLREAAPYIHKHRGKIFVIAFAGEVIENEKFSQLIKDIAILSALGTQIVLVHGARPQVDRHLQALDHDIQVVDDMRVTDSVTLQTAKEAIGALRVEIENQLSHALSMPPVVNESLGVLSGNFITAQPLGIHNGTDFQHTGTVRKINAKLIKQLTAAGSIVLLSSLGFSPSGEAFNLRYEDVASFAAKSLQADKLIFIHADAATPTLDIDLQQLDSFIEANPEQSRLLNHIKAAMNDGVERVHLVSTETKDGLLLEIYTRDGIGTMFNASQYENIRQAKIEDVSGIIDVIEPLELKGALIKRSREQLELEIDKFSVIERDGKIIACAALYLIANTNMGELACLAVHPDYKGGERGDRLLKRISQEAMNRKLSQLLVLTTQSIDWFKERGFEPGEVEDLPDQKKALYNFQRKSKILLKELLIKT